MIYTVTFNPSLDYMVGVDNFKLGTTNRTSYEQMLAGGKGINVSYVLKNLGFESTAFGFLAGFVGEEIRRKVAADGIYADFLTLSEGVSRINVKLKNIDGTEINGMGPDITVDQVSALREKIHQLKATSSCSREVFHSPCRIRFTWISWRICRTEALKSQSTRRGIC
jgi:1-phosphofructokinase